MVKLLGKNQLRGFIRSLRKMAWPAKSWFKYLRGLLSLSVKFLVRGGQWLRKETIPVRQLNREPSTGALLSQLPRIKQLEGPLRTIQAGLPPLAQTGWYPGM